VCGFKISHQKGDVLLKHIPGITNSNHKQRKFPVNPRNGQRAGKRLPGRAKHQHAFLIKAA